MTHSSRDNKPVAVEQSDRDAGYDHAVIIGRIPPVIYRDAFMRGDWDASQDVQAFASYRLRLAGQDRGDRYREALESIASIPTGESQAADFASQTAIAALSTLTAPVSDVREALIGPGGEDPTLGRFGWLEAYVTDFKALMESRPDIRAAWLEADPDATFEAEREVDALIRDVRQALLHAAAGEGYAEGLEAAAKVAETRFAIPQRQLDRLPESAFDQQSLAQHKAGHITAAAIRSLAAAPRPIQAGEG